MADECPKCPEGLPPWLATFADLMSLLMCFFVLLLSFAEVDAQRFKKMAESMKDAFGVQREIPAVEIVKGTSVIMQEFSPGKPEPSPIEDIRQITSDLEQEFLDRESKDANDVDEAKAAMQAELEREVQAQAEELQEMLESEISDGLIDVETESTNIIIRIQEKGSFPSGRANLNPDFFEVISKIT
ncbi:MAG: type VI secretion system protein TssL, partial [Candidatus Thiodiazotropha taylori]|nr:type VI secretion system protein TssL [Candidatus Thiodiazotropha taylori]